MRQKLLLSIGAGLVAASLVVGAAAAFAGWGSGTASFWPGGMMGAQWTTGTQQAGKTISIDQAQQAVQTTLDRIGNRDLVIDEVLEFQDNYYAIVKEKSTGTGAFELLVSRTTGAVTPEPGPNMMWNTRYGMMSGQVGWMMGGGVMGAAASAGP